MADPQIVGQIIAGVATFLVTGGAAYLGARSANRSTKVEDARAREAAEWERISQSVDLAVSSDPIKSYVGIQLLVNSKADWNSNPEQRAFIKQILEALIAPAIQAYGQGKTSVVTSTPESSPADPVAVTK
jgi:hypothetical protein